MVATITAIPLQAIGAAFTAISLAFVEASAPLSVTLARLSPPTADPTADVPFSESTSPECQSNPCPCLAYQLDRRLLGLGSIGGDRRGTGIVPDRRATISRPPVRHRSRRRPAIAGSRTPRPCEIRAAHHLWNSHGQHCSRRCCCRVPTLYGPCRRGVADAGRRRAVPRIQSATRRRSLRSGGEAVELLEYLAFAVVVPLAVWLCGLYGAARSLNLS